MVLHLCLLLVCFSALVFYHSIVCIFLLLIRLWCLPKNKQKYSVGIIKYSLSAEPKVDLDWNTSDTLEQNSMAREAKSLLVMA